MRSSAVTTTLDDIKTLVRSGESDTLEFKKSTANLARAGETLCGMLNGAGGVVLFGVTDAGEVVGQQVSDRTMQEVAELLRGLDPAAPVRVSRVQVGEERDLLVLETQPVPADVPYQFRNVVFQRVGPTTSPMPRATVHQLVVDRTEATRRWETILAPNHTINDLDHEEIRRTVRLGIQAGRLPEDAGQDIPEILERLALAENGQLKRAALVLFGTRLASEFPQCSVRLARFAGMDKSRFLDGQQEVGHAFDVFIAAMEFFRKHLPIAGHFLPDVWVRQDEPLFPIAALREAVVNALIHRSYADPGGAVSIAIFDDRLEIWSEGGLPSGVSLDSLKQIHRSRPRNPTIADVFYRRGLIERWGRGTQTIVELCVRAGHPEPIYGESDGAVWVRFISKTPMGSPLRRVPTMTDRQIAVLRVLAAAVEPIPFARVLAGLSDAPSERTVRNDLVRLRELGMVAVDGHGRGATWRVLRENKATE